MQNGTSSPATPRQVKPDDGRPTRVRTGNLPTLSRIVQMPKVGESLAHYKLVQELGSGGMGAVFKAFEEKLNRHVAIKVLARELAVDAEFAHRFLHEAQAVAALNHPNIITVYYIGQQQDIIFFAMEFVEGRPLNAVLHEKQKLSEREALDYIRQTALGLQAAQERGLIHRDVKPANLMLTQKGVIKIADFGLAQELTSANKPTASRDIIGTPEYMSPEQAEGRPADHRSDIYSLGATLYHLLAGQTPYFGDSETAILTDQVFAPVPSIRSIRPDISHSIERLLDKMLSKSPKGRFQTYDELIAELNHMLGGSATTVVHSPVQLDRRSRILAVISILSIAVAVWSLWNNFSAKRNYPQIPPKNSVVSGTQLTEPTPVPLSEPSPPPAPAPQAWFPLDLSAACNRHFIASETSPLKEGFDLHGHTSWATTNFLRQRGGQETGVPNNGQIPVPAGGGLDFFQLRLPATEKPENDAIVLTSKQGVQPQPVTWELPSEQRKKYAQLAVLHAAAWGDIDVELTAHYDRGLDQTLQIQILNWSSAARTRTPGVNQARALLSQPLPPEGAPPKLKVEMFADTIALDPTRTLQSLTFAITTYTPPTNIATSFTDKKAAAAIFAISALPAPPTDNVDDPVRWANAINLLALIDPKKDAISGRWNVTDGELQTVGKRAEDVRLEIPYTPPDEYDFRIIFTRRDGDDNVKQILTHGGRNFAWTMGAYVNTRAAFELINGAGAHANPSTVEKPGILQNDKQHTSIVQVRNESVKAYLDGELLAEWKTDYSDLGLREHQRLRDQKLLGISTYNSVTVFHRIEILEIAGRGGPTRPTSPMLPETN